VLVSLKNCKSLQTGVCFNVVLECDGRTGKTEAFVIRLNGYHAIVAILILLFHAEA